MGLIFNAASDHSHSNMSPFAGLLLTVVEAIAEVFLTCLAGYYLARKGILNSAMRKNINKLNVSAFTPALLFSKVAFSLTPEKLKELWIIPLSFVVVTTVSAIVAYSLAKLFRIKRRSHVAFAIACGCFANSNSLPIALMQSLVVGVEGLKWGKHDTKDQMLGRALSYLTLYSTLGIVLRWSVGVKLLSAADDEPSSKQPSHMLEPGLEQPDAETAPLLNGHAKDDSERTVVAEPDSFSPDSPPSSPETFRKRTGRKDSRPGDFTSFPNTPRQRAPSLPDLDSEDEMSDPEWGLPSGAAAKINTTLQSTSAWRARQRRRWRIWVAKPAVKVFRGVTDFMTTPLYAALLSIVVACIPPLQKWLETVKPVVGALRSAGNCSVPLTLVVLGGFMHQEDDAPIKSASLRKPSHTPSGRPRPRERPSFMRKPTDLTPKRPGERRTIAVALLSRMVITPLIIIPLLYWWSAATHNIADDPCFLVAFCLLCGSPPAITLAQITEAAAGDFERLLSRCLLTAYVFLTPPTTIILVLVGLMIAKEQ